jgi:hypothetical protein
MAQDFTMWTNLSEGVLAFTCMTRDMDGTDVPIKPLSCVGLKIMLVMTTVMVILSVYQVGVYYFNHRQKLWKTRQRIMYLNVIYTICLTICLAFVSVLGVYHLTFFFQQLLFLQVLDYLIKKIEKLTMGNFIKL